MAKIQYIAFGGQDERYKSCSAITINDDIYILNCGIHNPPEVVLGIQKIIPDFSWIIKNKQKVKGIFIGTPTYSNFGGLEFLINQLPKVPIYTSQVGAFIINNYFNVSRTNSQNVRLSLNIIPLISLNTTKIGNAFITPFRVVNTIPFSIGFIFNTTDGGIIFVDDFILPTNKNVAFYDMIFEINRITKFNNLLLITSMGIVSMNSSFTTPKYKVNDYYENTLIDAKGRIIFAIFDHDVYKVLTLANITAKKSLPFTIYSNTFTKLFEYLNKNKLISIPNLLWIDDTKINDAKKGVIVITGTTQRLIAKLQKIIDGEDAKISFQPSDTFVMSTHIWPGYEKINADLIDSINRLKIDECKQLPKDILPLSASVEDHKFLANLLKPKYIIPQKGLFMDYINYINQLKLTNIDAKNAIVLENGQVVEIQNCNLVPTKKFIKVEEQYIGSQGVLDVAANSLFERQQMSENGAILISLVISKNTRKIIHNNFDSVGIVNHTEDNKQLMNSINNQIMNLIEASLSSNENFKINREIQNTIRKQILKLYEKNFGKKPLVLLTLLYDSEKNDDSCEISDEDNILIAE